MVKVNTFDEVCWRRLLRVGASSSKFLMLEREGQSKGNIFLNCEVLKDVIDFRLLDKNGNGKLKLNPR